MCTIADGSVGAYSLLRRCQILTLLLHGHVYIAGADQVTLDGVYHSPLGSVIAVYGKVGRPWYCSPEVLPKWIQHISCDESDSMVELGDTLPPNV